ncbi:ribosome maturation factor RimP [Hutsoniella sourekii]|uniref:ribosome maturation factor RimP n=1 Tax=Hutsoniella sourekii TaxID=87650 RepID=UPI0004869EE7|nr:ribosome maturation factor RimP [Hutsoniella sourekii]
MTTLIDKIQPVVEPVVASHDCQLVSMEYVHEEGSWYLRVYADKAGGIDLNDCVAISEDLSEVLDNLEPDPFPKEYYLEVASPGAERPLPTPEAIEAAVGSYVHFDYYNHQHGETFHEGTLLGVEEDHYLLEVQIKSRKKTLEIDKDAISFARLAVKF